MSLRSVTPVGFVAGAGNVNKIYLGALLELLLNIGTAVVIVPIMRRQFEELSIGKDWTFLLGPGWIVGWGNGLILGYMMFRTGLVPRPVTWLGLIGGPLIIISGTVVMFGGGHGAGTFQGLATIPEGLWELFLGVYCTIWGFKHDAPILSGSVR